jgi:hypothetical protein
LVVASILPPPHCGTKHLAVRWTPPEIIGSPRTIKSRRQQSSAAYITSTDLRDRSHDVRVNCFCGSQGPRSTGAPIVRGDRLGGLVHDYVRAA